MLLHLSSTALALFDAFVSFYQAVCFPIYKINEVKRSDYIFIDRYHLAYLNLFEKRHCVYCAYANGLTAHFQEILSHTEQYFCPRRYTHKISDTHQRYRHFIHYMEADNYHEKLEDFRQQLSKEK